MDKNSDNLALNCCKVCGKSLPLTGNYIKCHHCGSKYHYSPCATLSESTYSIMSAEKKAAWKCHTCRGDKGRSKSPNSVCPEAANIEQQNQQQQAANKQQRSEDENEQQRNNKKFKDSISLNIINTNMSAMKVELATIRNSTSAELGDIKASISQLSNNIITSNNLLREDMTSALLKLTESMTNLSAQVNELKKENAEKELRIKKMESKVNMLEQKLLNKSIEIKNVNNSMLDATYVIKTIAASINVKLNDTDIGNAYNIKRSNKTIIEFTTVNKKKEILAKVRSNKIKGDVFNTNIDSNTNNSNVNPANNNQPNNKPIYINEQLTAYNRQLLWLAKTKAKDSGWKFVWVRDGNIYAKKNENTTIIKILNNSDIELIAN